MLQVPCPLCGHLNPIHVGRCEGCGQLARSDAPYRDERCPSGSRTTPCELPGVAKPSLTASRRLNDTRCAVGAAC